MYTWFCLKICRFFTKIGQLYGGGSALPGLIMEKIHPKFTKQALANLPKGVVVVSGTNGKTSTTKALVQILNDQGLRVFTNPTGSNFLRGVTSALISQVDSHGQLEADIAVLELDEAHAIHFIDQIPPRYSLLLNVMRDQLDRFGEIDTVTNLLRKIALATTENVILNREDWRLAGLAPDLKNAKWFGYSSAVRQHFPTLDGAVESSKLPVVAELINQDNANYISFHLQKKKLSANLKISGIYNHFNIIGAAAAAQAILGKKLQIKILEQTLTKLEPAFGRGETINFEDTSVELILIKNPSGFQMALNSNIKPETDIMIAINDNYADGRDTAWLWDVDFSRLPGYIHSTTGSRSKDMALRLKYDQKMVEHSSADIKSSLKLFMDQPGKTKQIFTTYTAMLEIRRQLLKMKKQVKNDS